MNFVEEWRPVVGFEKEYEVSNLGNVRSLNRSQILIRNGKNVIYNQKGQILTPFSNGKGYLKVILSNKKRRYVAHIVAEAFIGPRAENYEVCHNNGIRNDNRVENLRYDTASANQLDRRKHGTKTNSRGERNVKAKLTENDVMTIRAFKDIFSKQEMANAFNCHTRTIWIVQTDRGWL